MKKVLCGDIGGTNANLAIAEINDEITIQEQIREPTAKYTNFSDLINQYLKQIKDKPTQACFAVAGPVIEQRVEMTNVNLIIDQKEIEQNTPLQKALIINDFDAVGYATNVLAPSDIKVLNHGKPEPHATRAAIGAGTGLGKSLLVYEKNLDVYIPHPSEGGHSDFPIQSEEELKMVQGIDRPTYEDLLSGRGLEHLYQYFQKITYPNAEPSLTAQQISEKLDHCPCCKETFDWFVKFYARCARNFAIEVLALGGIYIAGGIAASNHPWFEANFMEEFTRHPLFHDLLQDIPVTLIKNYDISLKGAAKSLILLPMLQKQGLRPH